jgi:hypothetical protein
MLPFSLDCFCFVGLRPVYPTFPVFLDCFFCLCLARGTQDEDKQNKNNPEKLVTWGTQYEEKQGKNNAGKLVR